MASRRQQQAEPIRFDLSRGEFRGGDSGRTPDGFAKRLRNMILNDGVWDTRPQFTYDQLTNIRGLGLWYDDTSLVTRLMSIDTSRLPRAKATSGESWGSTLGTFETGTACLLDSVSYKGQWFAIGGTSAYLPKTYVRYNGTTLTTVNLSGYSDPAVLPYSLTPYKQRVFFGGVQLEPVETLSALWGSANEIYDPSTWTLSGATASTITEGSTTLYRLTPTSTTAASAQEIGFGAIQGANGTSTLRWLSILRNTSATYRMPITLQFKIVLPWVVNNAYALSSVVVPTTANNLRYRCTVAGTSHATTEPVWPVTVGATIVDNTVTWTCEGSDIIAQKEFNLPTLTESQDPIKNELVTLFSGGPTWVACVVKFGTTAAPTISLYPIDFGYKDGLAVGTPNKANFGQQTVIGTFSYPFANIESGSTATVQQRDYLYWSEPLEPSKVKASNYYIVRDVPGPITGVRAAGERLCLFKRNAFWIFGSTENPSIPVLPDGDVRVGVGILNPKACDIGPDGKIYGVGDDFVWRMKVGGGPEDICTDAMRTEMMNKSASSWCESQAAPNNRALLTIDQKNKLVYVYTQKGKLYCFDIDTGAWSTLDAGGDNSASPVGYEICDMIYNPNTGHVYVAFGTTATGTAGLARLDASVAPAKDQISSSGTLSVHAEVWPAPIETSAPMYDIRVDDVWFHHNVTSSQTDQTTTALVSTDHGVTFPKSVTVELAPLAAGNQYRPMRLPLWQAWDTLLVRLRHSGNGQRSSFNVSQIYANIHLFRGAFPKTEATPVSQSL